MDILEVVLERHSVRSYSDKKIEGETLNGLHMQLVLNEPKAFDSLFAHYGKFEGFRNYVAIVGPRGSTLAEKASYFEEQLVLLAPTAINQRKFVISYNDGKAEIKAKMGLYSKVNLGIVRCRFKMGSERKFD